MQKRVDGMEAVINALAAVRLTEHVANKLMAHAHLSELEMRKCRARAYARVRRVFKKQADGFWTAAMPNRTL